MFDIRLYFAQMFVFFSDMINWIYFFKGTLIKHCKGYIILFIYYHWLLLES